MKTITLTRGKVALVDDELHAELRQHKWCTMQVRAAFYAGRFVKNNGQRKCIYMHHAVTGIPCDCQVDHINLDTLDNQLHNLRRASNLLNQANKTKLRGCTSKYKGVHWHKRARKWEASIRDGALDVSERRSRRRYLGSFAREEDAGLAYDS